MELRLVFKDMETPVGKLRLIATDKGLTAILWEGEDLLRTKLSPAQKEEDHPILILAEQQIEEERLSSSNYHTICDYLAVSDPDLSTVITAYGYPPLWTRPNTFETLVHIILEQQVSLASAMAALVKLREYIGEISPEKILLLSDQELNSCYFSRQKTAYTRYLANAIVSGELKLEELELLDDHDVRSKLITLKGIGNWTIDVYLMFVLQRADIFPVGDLAAVNAFKKVKNSRAGITSAEIVQQAEKWKPFRTAATMILWHWYLSQRKKS